MGAPGWALAVGSRVILKPVGGRVTGTTITDLDPHRRFTTESRIPFGRMVFEHLATSAGDGRTLAFTHRLSISGPLTRVFRRIFADALGRSLPQMMDEIARFAETSHATA